MITREDAIAMEARCQSYAGRTTMKADAFLSGGNPKDRAIAQILHDAAASARISEQRAHALIETSPSAKDLAVHTARPPERAIVRPASRQSVPPSTTARRGGRITAQSYRNGEG